jgi:hypothetical protein
MLKEPKQVLRELKVDTFQKYTYSINLVKINAREESIALPEYY